MPTSPVEMGGKVDGGALRPLELVLFSDPILSKEKIEKLKLGTDKRFSLDLEISEPQLGCLLYTSPSPRDATLSRMPSSA